jgi:chaperonin GroEL (HSP60 family)
MYGSQPTDAAWKRREIFGDFKIPATWVMKTRLSKLAVERRLKRERIGKRDIANAKAIWEEETEKLRKEFENDPTCRIQIRAAATRLIERGELSGDEVRDIMRNAVKEGN